VAQLDEPGEPRRRDPSLSGNLAEPATAERAFARVNNPAIVVSVIVNYYERESTIHPVVERLLGQSVSLCRPDQIEVIVVDDGSERGELHRKLPDRVIYLWQRKRRYGISRAKNTGAKIANGRYLVFLDADILVAADYVDAVLRSFEEWDRRTVHCGYIAEYHDSGQPDPRTEFGVWENPGVPTGRFFQLAGGNMAIARDLFFETPGFDEELIDGGVEDLLFGYQLGLLPRTSIRFDRRMLGTHLPHPPSPAHANVAASWEIVRSKYPDFHRRYIVDGLR
jgi:cellulose synthase/poly-beta-1,6-N-acetylglucosamine synthase-like glycosyltransferase